MSSFKSGVTLKRSNKNIYNTDKIADGHLLSIRNFYRKIKIKCIAYLTLNVKYTILKM